MLEVVQSVDLIRQAMDRYSACRGPLGEPLKINEKLPVGDAYLETECPRGQMGFYLVGDGTPIPWRARAEAVHFPTSRCCTNFVAVA